MVRWQVVWLIGFLLLLAAAISLNACGGGGGVLTQIAPTPGQATPAVDPPDGTPDAADGPVPQVAPRNTLALSMPALAQLAPGAEFAVVLAGRFVGEVYQGSARISFDPEIVQPLSTERGGLLKGDMVHLAGINQPDHVPFAFTALPEHQGIRDAQGTLLTVRFRLLSPVGDTQPVSLLNDAQYLQLRDRQGQRLSFDTEFSAGVR